MNSEITFINFIKIYPEEIVDLVVSGIFLISYLVVFILLCKRKGIQPIKMRNFGLIFTSVFASGVVPSDVTRYLSVKVEPVGVYV